MNTLMNKETNQQVDVEYEIWISEGSTMALILKGNNIDELVKDAERMYPRGKFIIKSSSKQN